MGILKLIIGYGNLKADHWVWES